MLLHALSQLNCDPALLPTHTALANGVLGRINTIPVAAAKRSPLHPGSLQRPLTP
jgi:hypothetical protein